MQEVMEYLPSKHTVCDVQNEQNLEKTSKELVTKALNCRLPWIDFENGKLAGFP